MSDFSLIPPKARQWLAQLGITSPDQLQQLTAHAVFQALQRRRFPVNRRLLWGLMAIERGCHWSQLTDEEKQQAWQAVQQGFPPLMPDELPVAEQAMQLALAQAQLAQAVGEVPVGAVVMQGDTLIAVGHNLPRQHHDPTAHAEIVALRRAAEKLANYRLQDCTLYVTLEPCVMCAGAILHARLQRVVFGAYDARAGAAGSVCDVFAMSALNHQTAVSGGLLATPCRELLQQFFAQRRS